MERTIMSSLLFCSGRRDDRFTIALFGKRAEFRNRVGNKILRDAFAEASHGCVMRESSTWRVIDVPGFFEELCPCPDQQVIDCMALSYPGPNLVLLAVDSDNSQQLMDQVRKLQCVFGDNITANLVVVLPTTDVLKSLHHVKKHFIRLEPVSDRLGSDCRTWCSGQRSFHYSFNNYSKDVVQRRRSTLDKRR